jgi:probable HAF family extracellular repeat protein
MIGSRRVLRLNQVEEQMKATKLIFAGSLLTAVAIAQTPTYTVTDLGPVGASPGQPFSINHRSLVGGAAGLADGFSHGVLWYKGWEVDIGKPGLGGQNSIVYGVNSSGQAVGGAETSTADPHKEDFCGFKALGMQSAGTTCMPFVWQDGVMTPLQTLGGNNGFAHMINNLGEVAGQAETTTADPTCTSPAVYQFKPVLWRIGGVLQLPTFPGDPDGIASAVNDHGQVVGASGECAPFRTDILVPLTPLHALLWQNGVSTDLGSLGGTGHFGGNLAFFINNLGEVVGQSDLPGDVTGHAFLWTKATGMKDLGTLPGDALSAGVAINDNSEVVGVSLDATFNPRAFWWQNGVINDLNAMIPADSSLFLLLACSITASGEITGLAVDKTTGEAHGYIATPAPTLFTGANPSPELTRPVLSEHVRQLIRQQLRLARSEPR